MATKIAQIMCIPTKSYPPTSYVIMRLMQRLAQTRPEFEVILTDGTIIQANNTDKLDPTWAILCGGAGWC
jgi:hypothetical protein